MAVCKQNKILCIRVPSNRADCILVYSGIMQVLHQSKTPHSGLILLLFCNHQIGLELLLWIPCMLYSLLPFGIVFLKPTGIDLRFHGVQL